jgi:hypothetical protein
MKVSYDTQSEENEVSSVTNMEIERVELNMNIVPKTFTFEYRNGDVITDHRNEPPTQRIYSAPTPPNGSEA